MVKAAHMKLSHSRMPFVRVYFRETQELVFDAHDKAFAFYGGVCRRGIYDNMKTAVEAIHIGKARKYNQRFLQMCSHHLVDPVAARLRQAGGRGGSRTRSVTCVISCSFPSRG
jgi:transposase